MIRAIISLAGLARADGNCHLRPFFPAGAVLPRRSGVDFMAHVPIGCRKQPVNPPPRQGQRIEHRLPRLYSFICGAEHPMCEQLRHVIELYRRATAPRPARKRLTRATSTQMPNFPTFRH